MLLFGLHKGPDLDGYHEVSLKGQSILPPSYLFHTKSFYYTPPHPPAPRLERAVFEAWRTVAGNELRPSEMGVQFLLKGSSEASRTELT